MFRSRKNLEEDEKNSVAESLRTSFMAAPVVDKDLRVLDEARAVPFMLSNARRIFAKRWKPGISPFTRSHMRWTRPIRSTSCPTQRERRLRDCKDQVIKKFTGADLPSEKVEEMLHEFVNEVMERVRGPQAMT